MPRNVTHKKAKDANCSQLHYSFSTFSDKLAFVLCIKWFMCPNIAVSYRDEVWINQLGCIISELITFYHSICWQCYLFYYYPILNAGAVPYWRDDYHKAWKLSLTSKDSETKSSIYLRFILSSHLIWPHL